MKKILIVKKKPKVKVMVTKKPKLIPVPKKGGKYKLA